MKFILDTHILLWALGDPARLSRAQAEAIRDPSNTAFVGAVSIVEIAIKSSIGKLRIEGDILSAVRESGFELLEYTADEAMLLTDMPFHHRDPFDRMIITQSIYHGYAVMTNDSIFAAYPCSVV